MKIRRLSEIDLARIATLPFFKRKPRLRLINRTWPPHSYSPFRSVTGELLNFQPELLGAASFAPWEQIAHRIAQKAKSETEARFNLAVGQALYRFGLEHNARSYRKPIPSWNVGYGQSVSYWWNFYTVLDETPCFVFFDPRLSNPLTANGRRFVLSMMHERIRVPDPDFVNARLLVVQFAKADEGGRVVRVHELAEQELIGQDELNDMIGETYRLWIEVLAERADEAKYRPTGSTPMGF